MTNQILDVLKEGLSAWKAFLNTREKAYKRAISERSRRAIDFAEKFILTYRDVSLKTKVRDARLKKYEKLFWKYNQ